MVTAAELYTVVGRLVAKDSPWGAETMSRGNLRTWPEAIILKGLEGMSKHVRDILRC